MSSLNFILTYIYTYYNKMNKLVEKKKPWNCGKRKPVIDDCGNKWCNCVEPKLTSNSGGRGLAYCLLCHTPWYC